MRQFEGHKDCASLRRIAPDSHMSAAIQYLPRAQWEAKSRFQCWIEDDAWFLGFTINKSSIRILGIGVAPEKRSKGIGGRLVARLAEYGRSKGIEKITLRTRPEGREFLFYVNHGFVPVAFKGDDVEMELDIANA